LTLGLHLLPSLSLRFAERCLGDKVRKGVRPKTLGGDKGYDTRGFIGMLREREITPHIAQNIGRKGGSAIDGRTTRHDGYTISQRIRKRIEEVFGWMKGIGVDLGRLDSKGEEGHSLLHGLLELLTISFGWLNLCPNLFAEQAGRW